MKRFIPVSDKFDGHNFFTVKNGVRMATPLFAALVVIEFTDVIFALDSIPAIFGITQSPFIVFTANVFALMGLRQLYFLLGHLVDKLEYLKYGIAFILAFIGFKYAQTSFINNRTVGHGRPCCG